MLTQAYSSPHLQSSIAFGVGKSGQAHRGPHRSEFIAFWLGLVGPILKWAQAFFARSVTFFWWELYGQPCIKERHTA